MKWNKVIIPILSLLWVNSMSAQTEDIHVVSSAKDITTSFSLFPKLDNTKGDYVFTDKNNNTTFSKKEKIVIRLKPEAKVGDVDGDGSVTVADVNKIVNVILGRETDTLNRSDIDGNGKTEITDVTKLIEKLQK